MILGDLEAEMSTTDGNPSGGAPAPHSKAKHNVGSVRNDVDDIVTGHSFHPSLFSLSSHWVGCIR